VASKLSIELVVDDKGNVTIDKTRQNFGKLDDQIRKADSSLGKLGGGIAKIGALVGGAFVLSGMTQLAKDSLEAMDNIAKLSQKVGVATDTLQTYGYAARLSGIELETVAQSLGKLAKNMATETEEADRAFKAIGVATKDNQGKLRGLDDVMGDVADRFAGMEDGTTKTALAMNLFGRAGAEMIPMLNLGREGLSAYAQEARRLGLVVTRETLLAVESLNDNLSRIKWSMQGVVAQSLGSVVPALDAIATGFIDSTQKGKSFITAAEAASSILRGMASAAVGTVAAFDLVGTAVGEGVAAVAHAIRQLPAALTGGEVEKWEGGSSLEKKLLGYGDLIGSFWKESTPSPVIPRPKKAAPILPSKGADTAAKEAERRAIEAYKLGAKLEEEQLKRREKMADEYGKIVTEEADFARTENERQINAIISQENAKLGKLYELYLEGAISFEEIEKTKTAVEENAAAARLKIETDNAKRIADINYELVQDIIGMEQTEYNLRMDQIEAQKKKYIADGGDIVYAARWAANQQTKALINLGKRSDDIAGGMSAAFSQMYLDQISLGQASYDVTMGFYGATSNSFSSMIYDMKGGMSSFSDYWDIFTDSLWKVFADMTAKMVTQWLWAMATMSESSSGLFGGGGGLFGGGGFGSLISTGLSLFMPGLGSLFGGGFLPSSATGSFGIPASANYVPGIFPHGGGVVGETYIPSHPVNPAVFINAPRLHSGLASDEFPAILQKGEQVIPKGKAGAVYNITIPITVKGSIVTKREFVREIIPEINKGIREGVH